MLNVEYIKDDKMLKLAASKATESTFVGTVYAFKLSHKNHLQ